MATKTNRKVSFDHDHECLIDHTRADLQKHPPFHSFPPGFICWKHSSKKTPGHTNQRHNGENSMKGKNLAVLLKGGTWFQLLRASLETCSSHRVLIWLVYSVLLFIWCHDSLLLHKTSLYSPFSVLGIWGRDTLKSWEMSLRVELSTNFPVCQPSSRFNFCDHKWCTRSILQKKLLQNCCLSISYLMSQMFHSAELHSKLPKEELKSSIWWSAVFREHNSGNFAD